MATILDIGILNYFTPVFVFFLVFGVLYALLSKTNIFGDNKGLNSIVAFALGLLFILTPELMKLVSIFTPWFILLFIFVLMIVLLFLFIGVNEETVVSVFSERSMVWIIVIVAVTIFIYAMTQVYGTQIHEIYGGANNVTDVASSGLNENIGKILFHPRILGVIMILLIAAQVVRFIAGAKKD